MKLDFLPVQPGSKQAENCPIRDVLDRISDRWSMLALVLLSGGTLRFSELKRSIGDVSQRMLAQTLRGLERDGYISRKVYPTVPQRVEYTLTPLGSSLLKRLEPLIEWADTNHKHVKKARSVYVPPQAIAAL